MDLKQFALKATLALQLGALCCHDSLAFSPETHVWVGQQVLAEAQTGFVTIKGKPYHLDNQLVEALRTHPGAYLAGNIGPDAFPDPLVGQMTTHPGLKGGWQADDFLKHMLRSAHEPEELAFAYGFLGHASADIFAHSYINRYSGDIFLLTDGEDTVELRHFMLEKYIGQYTPAFARDSGAYSVPAAWIRDTMIFNSAADSQNQKPLAIAGHLSAAWAARRAVGDLERELVRARNNISDKAAELLSQQNKLAVGIPQAKLGVEVATGIYEAAKKGAEIEAKALEAATNALKTMEETLDRNKQVLSLNERLISEQLRIAEDTTKALGDLQSRVSQAQAQVTKFTSDLANTQQTAQREACDQVKKIPLIGPAFFSTVCHVVNETTAAWTAINNQVIGATDALNRAVSDLNQAIARRASADLERGRLLADSAAKAQENLVIEASKTGVQAAVAAKTIDSQVKQQLLDNAKQRLIEARKALDVLSAEIDKVKALYKQATDAIARLDPITGYVGNWRRDIDLAMEEFVRVGLNVGISTVRREGETISLYSDWWACWAPVFQGVPSVIPKGVCLLKKGYEDATTYITNQLGDAAWLIVPNLKLQKIIDEEIKKVMPAATGAFITFVASNKDLGHLVELMGAKGTISDNDLTELFSRDGTSKRLLLLPDIVKRVQFDLQIRTDGTFDPERFRPARNAVILAKLALLSTEQLNELHHDLTGTRSSVYGDELYPVHTDGRYSILFDAVRSIDGNQQWQEIAAPYPKQANIREEWSDKVRCDEQDKGCYGELMAPGDRGFRFWQDKASREKFFGNDGTVFLGPQSPGLDDNAYVGADNYPFPECAADPFPLVAEFGQIQPSSSACLGFFERVKRSLLAYSTNSYSKTVQLGSTAAYTYAVRPDIGAARWIEGILVILVAGLAVFSVRNPATRFTKHDVKVLGAFGLAALVFSGFNAQLAYLGGLLLLAAAGLWAVKRRGAIKATRQHS